MQRHTYRYRAGQLSQAAQQAAGQLWQVPPRWLVAGAMLGALLLTLLFAPAIAQSQEDADADVEADSELVGNPDELDPKAVSLGATVGDPTGASLRVGLGAGHALQANFGFSPFPGDALVATADWTYDIWDLLPDNPTASLLFFVGAGVKTEWFIGGYYAYRGPWPRFADRSHFGLGGRGLVGLRAPFRDSPFDLFAEVAPLALIFVVPDPSVYYDFDLAVGARYRF